MNYRHAFHAGSFADVFKHAILALLIERLCRKPAPFCILDTHAGPGAYDLQGAEAQRTGEYRGGIARIWSLAAAPPELAGYLAAVGSGGNPLHCYPGSPLIARRLLRPQDRLLLVETVAEAATALRRRFAGDRQVAVHHGDGYRALKGLLPPPMGRGLVLVDPPFEATDEFDRLAAGARLARRRWATGIVALWYPIKRRAPVAAFHDSLRREVAGPLLAAELLVTAETQAERLNGCGMIIANPPWQFDRTLDRLLPWLARHLAVAAGAGGICQWLTPE